MKLLIITHVSHKCKDDSYWAYAPYVREMNIWTKTVDQIIIVAPIALENNTAIDLEYNHQKINFSSIPSIHFLTLKSALQSIGKIPKIMLKIYKAMKAADHIHLRCPGNIGLLGCFVQILFPFKPKTAKYAGNWDPKSKQPWSYRLQKWILSNTFLTKNMQVLVYGEWPNQSKNIKPFFTATYSEKELQIASSHTPRNDVWKGHSESFDCRSRQANSETSCINNEQMLNQPFDRLRVTKHEKQLNKTLKFLFVGTLTSNKRPLLCAQVVQQLHQKGHQVQLTYYGEGPERHAIENFILDYNLQDIISLKGNVAKEALIQAYQEYHFLLFFSQSEGWPKAVAEAMFWGCLPITTAVSCVPMMVANGNRGALVLPEINHIVTKIEQYINEESVYQEQVEKAIDWSRQFTLEKLASEIEKLLITL